jgi:beta-phosphoglucomutase-like phosphatase (HAD superfamily)
MTLDINRIKAICFDIDGTLSDTDDLYIQKVLPFFKPFSVFTPKKEPTFLARRLIMNLETPGNELYHLLDRFGMDAFAGKVYSRINKTVSVKKAKKYLMIPGTEQVLRTLKQHFPLSVVSAGSHSSIFGFLEAFSLTGFFNAIATSQTCEYTKPFPHPVIWAAEQMKVKPEECSW